MFIRFIYIAVRKQYIRDNDNLFTLIDYQMHVKVRSDLYFL